MLPWVEVFAPFIGQLSVAGTKGDGKLVIIMAMVALAALLVAYFRDIRWAYLGALGMGILISALAIWKIVDFERSVVDDPEIAAFASVGMGLYLVLMAGIALAVCAAFLVKLASTETSGTT